MKLNPITFTPESLAALKESIAHWYRLYTGSANNGEHTGHGSCACCKLYFNGDGCKGCPIYQATGKSFCSGSPYISLVRYTGMQDENFKRDAKIFHDWLVALLPTDSVKKPNLIKEKKITTLNLTPPEAKTLECILQFIGGSPKGTRGYVNSIYKKLTRQEEKFNDVSVNLTIDEKQPGGRIYFNP